MSMRSPVRRWVILLVVLVAAGAAAGCGLFGGSQGGSGQESSSVPDGFTRVSPGGVSLAYPQGWKKVKDPDKGWTFTAQATRSGASYAQVSVLADAADTDDAAVAANTVLGTLRLSEGFKRAGEQAVEIPGASDAYRIDYRYHAGKGEDNSGPVVRGTDVAVVGGDGKPRVVRITRHKGQLEQQVLKSIIGTIQVPAK